jgi:hypothetical protein
MSNVLHRPRTWFGLSALAQLALAVAAPAPAAAFIPQEKLCWAPDQWQEVDCNDGPMQCYDAQGWPIACDAPCGVASCFAFNGQQVLCPFGGFGECEVAYCYAGVMQTDCVSGCGATECYSANWQPLSCAEENAVQACPPVHCFGPGGEAMDCATDCDIAYCQDAAQQPMACPIEHAYCGEGPALCCDAYRCYDQEEDCGLIADEAWVCNEALMSCATPEDDPGDYGDYDEPPPSELEAQEVSMAAAKSTASIEEELPLEAFESALMAGGPPMTGGSSCACSQNGGVQTDCVYDMQLVEFTPRSAPSFDRKARFTFTLDAGQGGNTFHVGNGWAGPDTVPVGTTVGVYKSFAQVAVPCGGARTVKVKLWGQEYDGVGADERGEMVVEVPLSCPGGGPVTGTHRLKLKNKRGKVKHEVDVTIEATVANRCVPGGGNVPVCNAPPSPPAACEFEVYGTELYHRQSPVGDKKGKFWGHFDPGHTNDPNQFRYFPYWNYPWVARYPTPKIKRGSSYDMRNDMRGPLATYNVPCGGSLTPQIPVEVQELDGFAGIPFLGKDDIGTGKVVPTLTCPPQQTSWFHRTEVPLYGHASKPRHIVDIVTQQKIKNLNYCAPEPQEGLVTPCELVVEVAKVTKVSGSAGSYTLDFELGDQHRWMAPYVTSGNPEWVPSDDGDHPDPVIGRSKAPCGEQVNAELTIRGEEADWFIFSWPSEFGAARVPLTLSCGQPPQTKTVRMDFRNKRGKVKDSIDIELRISENMALDPPACQCRQ